MKNIAQFLAITTVMIAMVSVSALVSYNGIQQASAATKNCSTPGTPCWCYTGQFGKEFCYSNSGDCKKAQASDSSANSGCSKFK